MKTDIDFQFPLTQSSDQVPLEITEVDVSTLTVSPSPLDTPPQITHSARRPACLRGIDEYLNRLTVETVFDE